MANGQVSTYVDLHDFSGTTVNANGNRGPDGAQPSASVTFGKDGNMFGATFWGGPYNAPYLTNTCGAGVLWDITTAGKYKDLYDFGFDVPYAGVIVGVSKLTFPSRTYDQMGRGP